MKGWAVLIVVILLFIFMGVNGAQVGEFVGSFLQGLRQSTAGN